MIGFDQGVLARLGARLRLAFAVPSERSERIEALLVHLGARDEPDRAAFGEELARLRPRLTAFARRWTRDPDLAEDLVQDTMLRAWVARARFDPGTNMRAWTFTILRNRFLSQQRGNRFLADYDETAAEAILSRNETQSASLELKQTLALLADLPHDQQAALRLVILEGESYENAADRLGVALGTLKSRVFRAKEAVRRIAGEQHVPSEDPPEREDASAIQISRKEDARRAWASAKAAGRPLIIG
ncbi:hypothetical protein SAQ01S_31830 [Sphingomonas aquatilis NBRC 16722]|uniref:RNA polymerase sigma-70 factor (ECF subfamily) n=1 Tax=Sphingomonas aquatilis TaxID=93063 RepID=A0AAW3TPB2_9SPHN|nr:sigma-70 family RNA polymerase sigma factor [Sphingomonas aquatilis]MBB3874988.1 RNA polymerase sigma-70 factor (ECF subfamily) [Sphingomonas aquatilis]GEM73417.1 hypothetical protein SAQ01S_31830 [Sphingomonas aquatilis NBRC 16722]